MCTAWIENEIVCLSNVVVEKRAVLHKCAYMWLREQSTKQFCQHSCLHTFDLSMRASPRNLMFTTNIRLI